MSSSENKIDFLSKISSPADFKKIPDENQLTDHIALLKLSVIILNNNKTNNSMSNNKRNGGHAREG